MTGRPAFVLLEDGTWFSGSATRRIEPAFGEVVFTTNITGYAYETVANQSIVAGQTSGGAHPAKSELMSPDRPAFSDSGPTLGMLAAGALAQPLRRREGDSIS